MAETSGSVETLTLQCRLVGELRRFLPDGDRGEGPVRLPGPATIEDLLIHLQLPERDALVVGINGTKAPHGDPLHDGDEVTIVAPMTGGSIRGHRAEGIETAEATATTATTEGTRTHAQGGVER